MMIPHTIPLGTVTMAKSKVAITLDATTLRRLDRSLLAEECAKLDPAEERALADEGLAAEGSMWPPY
jgi:hypothetical protein